MSKQDYTQTDYIKDCFHAAIDFVRWRELFTLLALILIGFLLFKWIGILIGILVFSFSANLEGGAVADVFHEYPKEEFPPNTCSAGIEGCKLCNNEYSHEFNEAYSRKFK